MKNKSTSKPLKYAPNFLARFNLVIFIVIVVIGLIASILILTDLVNKSYDGDSSSTTSSVAAPTMFDQQTISRLSKLNNSNSNNSYNSLPSGRVNPFSE
jgi:hypothetical protein